MGTWGGVGRVVAVGVLPGWEREDTVVLTEEKKEEGAVEGEPDLGRAAAGKHRFRLCTCGMGLGWVAVRCRKVGQAGTVSSCTRLRRVMQAEC